MWCLGQAQKACTLGQEDFTAEDAASSEQKDSKKAAAYDIKHFFSHWPVEKTDVHFKQTQKNGQNQQL